MKLQPEVHHLLRKEEHIPLLPGAVTVVITLLLPGVAVVVAVLILRLLPEAVVMIAIILLPGAVAAAVVAAVTTAVHRPVPAVHRWAIVEEAAAVLPPDLADLPVEVVVPEGNNYH